METGTAQPSPPLTDTWDAAKIACFNEISLYCVTDAVYFRSNHVPKKTLLFDTSEVNRSFSSDSKIVAHPEIENVRKGRHRASEFQAAANASKGNAEARAAVLLCGRRKIVNYALLPFPSPHIGWFSRI